MDTLAIIINNKAKNARLLSSYLEELSQNQIHYQLFHVDPKDLEDTLKQCVRVFPLILIGGGDGTIRSAAQFCVHTSITLGVFPLGTLNHFHKELGLPTTPAEIVNAIKKGDTKLIDLAEVNGSVFVNNSSLGFYPGFVRKRDRYAKFYNKWLSYIPSLYRSMQHHKTYTLTVKDKTSLITLNTSFLMVSNNVYSYQFPIKFERERFDGGVLGVYYLKYGKIKLSKILWSIFGKKSYFEIKKVAHPLEIWVRDQDKITISLDGENVEMDAHLMYKSLPRSLKILTQAS